MPHLELLIQYKNGQPQREPVHAVLVNPGVFRLEYSPGFVLGIAAGDEFILEGTDGSFVVTKRSGNLAIQIFTAQPIVYVLPELHALAHSLGGTVDGNIDRGAVLTVPASAGFSTIESAMLKLSKNHPALEWLYGNVYDPLDGVTPLLWWEKPNPTVKRDAP